MSNLVRLYQASAHHLPMIEDETVQTIVTSPPYFGLRLYDGEQAVAWQEAQYAPMAGLPPITVPAMECPLGNEPTIEAYIGHLILCLREWWRVLKADGVAWVNLGDSYASGELGRHDSVQGREIDGKRVTSKAKERRQMKMQTGVPKKSILMIPARFALAAQAEGWIVRSDIIWHKPNPMPESVTDRPTKAHEYIYLLAKQERYYYDEEAVRIPAKTDSTERDKRGNSDHHKNLSVAGRTTHSMHRARANGEGYEFPAMRRLRSVWEVPLQPYPGSHFAVFPPALIQPMIKAGSRVGDVVADFFNGSGTTGREAVKLGRRYIGTDLSEKYLDELAPDRLTVQMELTA